jgi:[histone H3]-lysine4 N-trimethyltransferase ASH1L
MKRAQSSDSASTLSNIDVAGPSTRDSLPVSTSSTPPTSVTESATPSEPDAAKDKELLQHRRSGRARTSIASYNDNVLSGTAVHTRKSFLKNTENDEATGSRAISGATLVDDGVDSPSAQLLGAGTKATQSEWMEESGSPSKADRRRSMRLDRLTDAASSAVGALTSATSVLGKRGRDALESAKDKFQDMNRRASMRLREPQPTKESSEERSPAKRVRMFPNLALVEPEKEAEPEKEKVPEKKPRKFWLKQGLYAGQVRETHPRQKSNKRQSSGETAGKERIYLPLPMFLGEKLLEAGRDFKLPYEILNALPRDQAPKDWRVLSKSKWLRFFRV